MGYTLTLNRIYWRNKSAGTVAERTHEQFVRVSGEGSLPPCLLPSLPPRSQLRCKEMKSTSYRCSSLISYRSISPNNSVGKRCACERSQHSGSPKSDSPLGICVFPLKMQFPHSRPYGHKQCCLVTLLTFHFLLSLEGSRARTLTKGQILMQNRQRFC